MVDSVSVRLKNAHVENMLLNIRTQWNAGTACESECVLKTLACRGLRVGPSKFFVLRPSLSKPPWKRSVLAKLVLWIENQGGGGQALSLPKCVAHKLVKVPEK